jgi:hypothetical protein
VGGGVGWVWGVVGCVMVWGVCGVRELGVCLSFALEHSKVCTLCDFGHLQFQVSH